MSCPEAALSLGAYVLGGLEPGERRQVEEHLERCPFCAAEVAEFRALPSLLARVDPDDLQPVRATPSPDLFDRVAAAARAEGAHPMRRTRRLLLVAAAVAAILGAGVTVWATRDGEQTWSASAGRLELTVTASEANEGTALDVTVDGLRAGQDCRLLVVDREGDEHGAGEWTARHTGEVTWRGWTTVAPSSLSEILLVGEDGRELLRVQI